MPDSFDKKSKNFQKFTNYDHSLSQRFEKSICESAKH